MTIRFSKIQKGRLTLDFSIQNYSHRNAKKPFISVVIPALNEEKFLSRAIESLIGQEYKNFELIVVDNNSSDGTSEIAKNLGAKVLFEPKIGAGFARQAGFRAAKGKIIVTTDADVILPADWLTRIAEEFKKDHELTAMGGLYRLYSGPVTARIAVSLLINAYWRFDRLFSGSWTLPGANLAIRREAFYKVGGFNTSLKLGEDAEISSRLKEVGKILFDTRFIVRVSGRRYKNGFISGLINYFPNAFCRIFFNKHYFSRLKTVREENNIFSKIYLFPLIVSVIFLFFIFDISNPQIAQAKKINLIKNKVIAAREIIRKENQHIKILIFNHKGKDGKR